MKNWSLLFIVFLLCSFQAKESDVPGLEENVELSAADKASLLTYFKQTKERLEDVTEDLSEDQLQYKVSEDRWSISECLEHIVLTEQMLFEMTRELLSNSPNPERRAEIKVKDEDLIRGIEDRSSKIQTSAELEPTGRYTDAEKALKEFENQREEMLDFINEVTEEDLRDHVSDSPFGTIDAFQSLIFIAGHTARHTKQIEEVMADAGFPSE